MTVRRGLMIDSPGFSSVINLNGNDVQLRCAYSLSHSPKPTQVMKRRIRRLASPELAYGQTMQFLKVISCEYVSLLCCFTILDALSRRF